MAALDLLGRRWALRLLWELRDGPLGARALRERSDGMSSSVLYERLAELTSAGLVVKDDQGDYALSVRGAELGAALDPLDSWARRWAADTAGRPVPPTTSPASGVSATAVPPQTGGDPSSTCFMV